MKQLVVIIMCCLLGNVFAQNPAHFVLGEDELAGVNIYDLYQDQKGDYWIATNQGIFRYDSYTFKTYPCNEMLSSSLFNILEDAEGSIYCNNLSGQIFQIAGDSCRLFFQIPDSLMFHEINMGFDNENNLTIQSGKIFRLSKNKKVEHIYYAEKSTLTGLYKASGGELWSFDASSGQRLEIKNHELTKVAYTDLKDTRIAFFKLGNRDQAFDIATGTIYDPYNGKVVKEMNAPEKRFYTSGETFWSAELLGGVQAYSLDFEPLFNNNILFQEYLISCLIQDREGNILLGTFGDGILILPNLASISYGFDSGKDKPTKLTMGKEGTIYVGTQKGAIYEIEPNQNPSLISQGRKHVECIAYINSLDALCVDNFSTILFDLQNNEKKKIKLAAIKDVYETKDGRIYVASNIGVFLIKMVDGEPCPEKIEGFDGRTNALAYDEQGEIFYAATSSGLKIGAQNKFEYFEMDAGPVICRNLLQHEGIIYACSQNQGVLVFEKGELVDQWNQQKGLPTNNIRKILPYENGFVIGTDAGIFVLDNKGRVEKTIKEAEGLTQQVILDLAIYEDDLFIVHNKGLQKMSLRALPKPRVIPTLLLASLKVNDQEIDLSSEEFYFNHFQDRLSFELSAKTLKYKSDMRYEYKLTGIDADWQLNNYEDNLIEYKSVPPGNYEFKYRLISRGQTGKTQVFSFSISPPFWRTWWFIVLLVITGLAGGMGIYLYQLRSQRRKANFQKELIASKLTAIQSQMNPHFIFNSLNSIQDLVLQQDGANAYNYISKFAFLVRKVLAFSNEEFVEVAEELKLLTVYLELEELRFKKDFEFAIQADEAEGVEIPPMIVQPFVENAIKHGLLHKEGMKKVSIQLKFSEDLVQCIIEDNGIGRKKSAEINKRKSEKHSSFSVKSIRSRFDILKSLYGGKLGVEFEDLYENAEPAGTRVILRLPFRRKF